MQRDPEEIGGYVRGRVVLVSRRPIGSELCRQLARMAPARLVLLDHAETILFQIERELVERGTTNIVPGIGDVKGTSSSTASSSGTGPRSCSTRRPTSTCR